jgi:hypothetical protein
MTTTKGGKILVLSPFLIGGFLIAVGIMLCRYSIITGNQSNAMTDNRSANVRFINRTD